MYIINWTGVGGISRVTHQMKICGLTWQMHPEPWDFYFPSGIGWFFSQSAEKTPISVWLAGLKIKDLQVIPGDLSTCDAPWMQRLDSSSTCFASPAPKEVLFGAPLSFWDPSDPRSSTWPDCKSFSYDSFSKNSPKKILYSFRMYTRNERNWQTCSRWHVPAPEPRNAWKAAVGSALRWETILAVCQTLYYMLYMY